MREFFLSLSSMKKLIALSVVAALAIAGYFLVQSLAAAGLSNSHVGDHVPAPADFEKFLDRDITAYFNQGAKKPRTTRHEFLRREPTQTGKAYPKYYLWIEILEDGKVVNEGAAWVAAMQKKEFQVIRFLSLEEMEKEPVMIELIFPLDVASIIWNRYPPKEKQ
ncbi:MAG: hypothetical protein K8R88_00120 [Armatimonadetes bacterium]|nr:hypothetical protein [Armatimonadota bacterium]